VVAFNRVGETPSSNTDCTTPPAGPTGFTATGIDPTTVEFTWTDNSTAEDGYAIGIDYGFIDYYGFRYWELFLFVGSDATSARLEGFEGAWYYTYFVVATRDGGYSDWSNTTEPTPVIGSDAAGSTSIGSTGSVRAARNPGPQRLSAPRGLPERPNQGRVRP
jgi:hypothetical protein